MIYLYAFGIAIGSLYALWIFFLAVMNLARIRNADQLTTTVKVLGIPVLAVGYVIDAFVNVFVMTILFLELPQETTVTSRLKRHVSEGVGWRYRIAAWFIPILDPADPSGHHISEAKP